MGEVLIGCLCAPNGNPQPGPRFQYKLRWLERLIAHAGELWAAGVPVVLASDYNVVPTDFDIYNPKSSWTDDALLQPSAREAHARLLAQGWCDATGSIVCGRGFIRFGIICGMRGDGMRS